MAVDRSRRLSTAKLSKEERTAYALETTNMAKTGRGNAANQLAKSNYLDRPETREFHSIVRKKCMYSHRTCLNSVQDMQKEILEYFDLCDKYDCVPVMIGLFNYLGLDQGYAYHIANEGSELSLPLKKAMKFVQELQEGAVMRNAINPVSFIFLAKNYYGMSDSQTITLKPDNSSVDRSSTMEALQEAVSKQEKEQKLLEYDEK